MLNHSDTSVISPQRTPRGHRNGTSKGQRAETVWFTVRLPRELIVRIDAGLRRQPIRVPRSLWIAQTAARAAEAFPEEAA